jgi:hypothetical protein
MSGKKSLVLSGIAAFVLAFIILLGGTISGHLPANIILKPTPNSTSQSPQTGSVAGYGNLAVLLTDPPQIPSGISAVYVSYDDVSFHEFATNIWYNFQVSGTVDVVSLVNRTITLINQRVPTGTYDQISLMINKVVATYFAKNITIFSGSQNISASVPGDINIYNSTQVASIFDLQSSILNLNSTSSPKFVFNAVAYSAQLPVSAQKFLYLGQGQITNLSSQPWWSEFRNNFEPRLMITGATLTTNSVSVTVKNVGNVTIQLKFVTVAPLTVSTTSVHMKTPYIIGVPIGNVTNTTAEFEAMPSFAGASIFLVLSNGSLVPISYNEVSSIDVGSTIESYAVLNPYSYSLQPGEQVTLSYTGPLTLFGQSWIANNIITPLGSTFIITVIGNNAVAAILVQQS